MAGPASNFDSEIKQAMSPKSMNKGAGGKGTSSNDNARADGPKKGGNFNAKPQPSPAQPHDMSNGAGAGPGGVAGPDTHANMIAAGQAHMDAIHQHINAMKGMGQ